MQEHGQTHLMALMQQASLGSAGISPELARAELTESNLFANNIISRARQMPLLRERFVVLLSGGYDRMDLDRILEAAGEPPETREVPAFLARAMAVSEAAGGL